MWSKATQSSVTLDEYIKQSAPWYTMLESQETPRPNTKWVSMKACMLLLTSEGKYIFLLPHYVHTKEKYFPSPERWRTQKDSNCKAGRVRALACHNDNQRKGSAHTSKKHPIITRASTRSARRLLAFLSSFEAILFLLLERSFLTSPLSRSQALWFGILWTSATRPCSYQQAW